MRFLQPDPLGLAGGRNFYAYAIGNPFAFLDPFWLCGDSVTYEFVSRSEHSAWYRFVHQPGDTIYVASSTDIFRDLARRESSSLNTVNISSHGYGTGVLPLGDIMLRAYDQPFLFQDPNSISVSRRRLVAEYQQAAAVMEALSDRMSTGGRLNVVVCGAGAGENGLDLENQLTDMLAPANASVRTWDNVVTFFGGTPVVSPAKFVSGWKPTR